MEEKFEVPGGLLYTREHEWVRLVNKKNGVMGVTDYAVKMLHEVVYVALPEVGSMVKQGETFGSVESIKAVSDVYSSFSGKVVKINEQLGNSPEIVNQSPYGEGWLIEIELSNYEGEVGGLLSPEDYATYIKSLSEKRI